MSEYERITAASAVRGSACPQADDNWARAIALGATRSTINVLRTPIKHEQAAQATGSRKGGFTLAELLVSMVVLVILVFLATQLVNSAATVTILGHKLMDADSEARQVFDRMAVDFGQMVKRTDIDYYCKLAPTDQFNRNDQIAFYSAVPGYFTSASSTSQQSPLSLVAYRVNNDSTSPSYNKLERLGKGLVWNGVSGGPTPTPAPMVFLPLMINVMWPFATDQSSPDSAYEVIGPDVFRFEYFYMLKAGAYSGNSPLQGYPCLATPCSGSQLGANVAAIGVTIAVIDPRSKVLLTKDNIDYIGTLNGNNGTTNFLDDYQPGMSRPGALLNRWRTVRLNANTTLPKPALSGIRVYERYFYLPQ